MSLPDTHQDSRTTICLKNGILTKEKSASSYSKVLQIMGDPAREVALKFRRRTGAIVSTRG
jgi:hypothetical protein